MITQSFMFHNFIYLQVEQQHQIDSGSDSYVEQIGFYKQKLHKNRIQWGQKSLDKAQDYLYIILSWFS